MKSRSLLIAVGALVAVAIAGGVAYATIPGPGNVYSACMLKGVGQIRLIDKSLPSTSTMNHCTDKEMELSWNQAGQPGPAGPSGAKGEPGAPGTNGTNGTDGKDGVSVTTSAEPAGDNCLGGGIQLTAVNGFSYVCNGRDGRDGKGGVSSYTIVEVLAGQDESGVIQVIPGGATVSAAAICPEGARPLGGGYGYRDGPTLEEIESRPEDLGNGAWGWRVTFRNPRNNGALTFARVYAVCATVS